MNVEFKEEIKTTEADLVLTEIMLMESTVVVHPPPPVKTDPTYTTCKQWLDSCCCCCTSQNTNQSDSDFFFYLWLFNNNENSSQNISCNCFPGACFDLQDCCGATENCMVYFCQGVVHLLECACNCLSDLDD